MPVFVESPYEMLHPPLLISFAREQLVNLFLDTAIVLNSYGGFNPVPESRDALFVRLWRLYAWLSL
jgi:hypothetical protein